MTPLLMTDSRGPDIHHGSPRYLPHAQQTEVGLQSGQQQYQRAAGPHQLREISQGFYQLKKGGFRAICFIFLF